MHVRRLLRTGSSWLAGLIAVAVPLCLLQSTRYEFPFYDWSVHCLLTGYHGESLRCRGDFPAVIDSAACAGMAYPLFYGFLYYKIAGCLALLGGAHLAQRAMLVGLTVLQYQCVRRAARRLGGDRLLAALAAAVSVWATYALTNLYNRGAVAEFAAGALLTCACARWFVLLRASGRAEAWRESLAVGLLLALLAGTHPITATWAIPVVAWLAALWLFGSGRQGLGFVLRASVLLVSFCLALVVVAPWLYVYWRFGGQLEIGGSRQMTYFSDSIDSPWVRLFPVPLDLRCVRQAPSQVATPFLDAQINWPLVVLFVAVAAGLTRRLNWRQRGAVWLTAGGPALAAAAALVLSVCPASLRYAPEAVRKVQFAYRLVGVVNLLLLLGLFAALWKGRGARLGACAAGVVLTLALAGLSVKLLHASQARMAHGLPLSHRDRYYHAWLTSRPEACTAYCTPRWLAPLRPEEAAVSYPAPFEIGTGADFGRALPRRVEMPRDGYCLTQVVPFPWETFRVDGRPVPPDRLRAWNAPPGTGPLSTAVAVPVSAGSHTLEYAITPDRKWKALSRLSNVTVSAWLVVVSVWFVCRAFARPRAGAAPAGVDGPPQPEGMSEHDGLADG